MIAIADKILDPAEPCGPPDQTSQNCSILHSALRSHLLAGAGPRLPRLAPGPAGLQAAEHPLDLGDAVLHWQQTLTQQPLHHGAHCGPVYQLQHKQVRLK